MTPDWTLVEAMAVGMVFLAILLICCVIGLIHEELPEWRQNAKNRRATRDYFRACDKAMKEERKRTNYSDYDEFF